MAFADGFFLTRSEMAWYWEHYVEKAEDRRHPHASPSRAADLCHLPPRFWSRPSLTFFATKERRMPAGSRWPASRRSFAGTTV